MAGDLALLGHIDQRLGEIVSRIGAVEDSTSATREDVSDIKVNLARYEERYDSMMERQEAMQEALEALQRAKKHKSDDDDDDSEKWSEKPFVRFIIGFGGLIITLATVISSLTHISFLLPFLTGNGSNHAK